VNNFTSFNHRHSFAIYLECMLNPIPYITDGQWSTLINNW